MRSFAFISLGLAILTGPAIAQGDCPWAGGNYAFSDHGIYGDFTVNADCTELVWERIKDQPETTALERTKSGWSGELSKASFELLENGKNLRLVGEGGLARSSNASRKN
ncbi:MAG: hypothetical protein AB3N11_00460 [Arenibacterium sp.]